MLEAIILAGGLGTRLKSVVPQTPKALAPIQDVPFLHILLKQMESKALFSKVILALGYKSEMIQTFLLDQSYSFSIEFSIENEPMGTGGALLLALNKVQSESFFVLNGDSFIDLDFGKALLCHRESKADLTLVSKEMDDISRYGSIEIDPISSRILFFKEKIPDKKKGFINAGVYLFEKSLFEDQPVMKSSLESDILPNLLKKRAFAYPCTGKFIDIGTPSSYNEAQHFLKVEA